MTTTKKHVSLLLALLMVFAVFAGVLLVMPSQAAPNLNLSGAIPTVHEGDTFTATLTVTGGTAPYSLGTTSGATTITLTDATAGTIAVSGTAAAGGDTISIEVTDSSGVPNTETLTLPYTVYDAVGTPTISGPTGVLAGEAFTLTASTVSGGSGGYTYTWNDGSSDVGTGSSLTVVSGITSATTYTVTVADDSGSTSANASAVSAGYAVSIVTEDTTTMTIGGPGEIPTQVSAFDLTASGVTTSNPYTWTKNGAPFAGNADTIRADGPGTYVATVEESGVRYVATKQVNAGVFGVYIFGVTRLKTGDTGSLRVEQTDIRLWNTGDTTETISITGGASDTTYQLDSFGYAGYVFDATNSVFDISHTVTAVSDYPALVAPSLTGPTTAKVGDSLNIDAIWPDDAGGTGFDYQITWYENDVALSATTGMELELQNVLPGTYNYKLGVKNPAFPGTEVFSNVHTLTVEGKEYPVERQGQRKFRVDVDFSKYKSSTVDGNLLSAEDATVTSGSTILELSESYYNNLPAGRHTLVMNFDDGAAVITFDVAGKGAGTGDAGMLIFFVALLAAGALGAVVIYKKRKTA